MAFVLGTKSRAKLMGVHPDLVRVVNRAIAITTQDFAVTDGLRTVEQQRRLFAAGATRTMNSKHLKQAHGYSHAVDLVPFIDGAPRWEWTPIWNVAVAVDQAATELCVGLVWGAIWDRVMQVYGGSAAALKAEVEAYKKRHPGSDFLDGPHYQLAAQVTAFADMEAPSPLFRVHRYQYEGRDRATYWFHCSGCVELHGINDSWTFNGDFERPTFAPSFKTWLDPNPEATREPYISGFVCHSFIRDGQIEFCSDSTHALAGQTVPIPPWPGGDQ